MRLMLKAARLSCCLIAFAAIGGPARAIETMPLPPASQQAAPQQVPWDIYKLAQGLAAGKGMPKDVARARQMFEQVMASGNTAAAGAAAVALARLAAEELKDPSLAARSLERGIALGDAGAMFARAQELARGRLQDRKRAAELYRGAVAAAKTVDLRKAAYFGLGNLHEERPLLSARLAVSYHQKAATLGNAWSLFAIGGIYDKGIGTTRNWAMAKEYYERTLSQGGQSEKRAAAFALAQLYLRKPHISPRRAAEYLQIGRRNGDVWSSFMLAGFYHQGRGVPKSSATVIPPFLEGVRRRTHPEGCTSICRLSF